ncbi:hypothetical protein [Magnetofaba australis]|uniref:DUF4139 domain-containing protein n=1 Tax=Magnetofaba australis IT-1 TaxID=1434232 RepID=A0A1Y2K3B5_9PROT|nr:hypothetical protein [Magnetofaba australis]OSM01525.1 hypothetical protein MAIT1_01513 [Magnetofaba australis IT-1]
MSAARSFKRGALAALGSLCISATAWADAAPPPISKVALFTSGVGYFEREGEIPAGQPIALKFQRDQINDVLKSLLLQSLDGGPVGAVSYPAKEPLARRLEALPINPQELTGLADLLNQLRGAPVRVTYGPESVSGRLLGVDKRPLPGPGDTQTVEDWSVNLSVSGALRAVPLLDVREIRLEDAALRDQLTRGLALLDDARARKTHTLTLRFPGNGTRRARIGYVTEAPIWKTSYRLVAREDGQAYLQGWAMVENPSDSDWRDVSLSLVSGRPISFIQDLYTPQYAQRPRIDAPKPPPPPLRMMAKNAKPMRARNFAPQMEMMADEAMAGAPAIDAAVADITPVAQALRAGPAYRFDVAHVELMRGQAAMLPIIGQEIPAEAVSVIRRDERRDHPWLGLRLKNSFGTHLPAGPVTVWRAGLYAGDAQLPDLIPGGEQLLTHGLDMKVTLQPPKSSGERRITGGRIVDGALWIRHKRQRSESYTARNDDDRERLLVIERTLRPGWRIAHSSSAPTTLDDGALAFSWPLAAGSSGRFEVVEERDESERFALLNGAPSRLLAWATDGAFSETLRAALRRAAQLKGEEARLEQAMQESRDRAEEHRQDQARVRENLQAAPRQSRFYERTLQKLDDLETRIEQESQAQQKLAGEQQAARDKLATYIRELDIPG